MAEKQGREKVNEQEDKCRGRNNTAGNRLTVSLLRPPCIQKLSGPLKSLKSFKSLTDLYCTSYCTEEETQNLSKIIQLLRGRNRIQKQIQARHGGAHV